jgi:hypothetical protein
MAQTTDFIIDNGTGSSVRADINDALMSLATLNSGATAPTNPVGWMLWLDTTQTTINIYMNDAWHPILQANATSSFPSGTRMIFNQASPPTGWVLEDETSHSDTALRVVTGTGGGVGGTVAFGSWLEGHVHSVAATVSYSTGASSHSTGSATPTSSPKYTDVVVGVKT